MDGERDVFCAASHPRPVFPSAPKLPAPQQKEAALDACREVNPSASLPLVLHAQERRLRTLSAALVGAEEALHLHPSQAPLPRSFLPPVGDRKAAQRVARAPRTARSQTLRELNSRRQQRRSQAARIQRAAASVATPPLGALFGPPAPPPAPTRAARQTAKAAARSAVQAVEKGVAAALTPPSKVRAVAGPPCKARFRVRENSCPCITFGPSPGTSAAAKRDARAAAHSAALAVAERVAAPLTPAPRKPAPAGPPSKAPFATRDSSLPCVTFPPPRHPLPAVPEYSWRLPRPSPPRQQQHPQRARRAAGSH
eukprot:jgi/Mesen1/11039/ME000098S10436